MVCEFCEFSQTVHRPLLTPWASPWRMRTTAASTSVSTVPRNLELLGLRFALPPAVRHQERTEAIPPDEVRTIVASTVRTHGRRHAHGRPGCQVIVNGPLGGLVLHAPGRAEPEVLYPAPV